MYKKIFITGGAGYVGAALVKKLLNNGYHVTVYDLMIYGKVLEDHENLTTIKADIRDEIKLKSSIQKQDIVIHLACISNDPSFELNPKLGKSINLDAFTPLVEISKKKLIKRFIYASSSSVYGVKSEKEVHENMSLEPLTDYSKYKIECESILQKYRSENFTPIIIRPATVCGYSPRQRLDLSVNILTNFAFNGTKAQLKIMDILGNEVKVIQLKEPGTKRIELTDENYECPKCKSKDITLHMGGIFGKYKCKDCKYVGPIILEED